MNRRHEYFSLFALIVFALGLRLCGNTYGLPHHYAPDEAAKAVEAMAWREHPFKHQNSQPSFLYSALFLTDLTADALEPAIRALHPRADELFPAARGREPLLIWLGRCLMALMSALTVIVIYFLGREVLHRKAGLYAAGLYAVIPLPVAASSYLKEDTPLTFFVALGLLLGMRYWRRPTLWAAGLAGAAAGAAFAAKYPGALMLVWMLAVAAAAWRRERRDEKENAGKRAAVHASLILAAFILMFFFLCPGFALRPGEMFSGVGFQIDYLRRGHHDGLSISPWEFGFLFYLSRAVIPGAGLLTVLAAAGGAALMWRRDRGRAALLLAWGAGYYLLAESMQSKPYPFFPRYILPVMPVVVVLAGVFIRRIDVFMNVKPTNKKIEKLPIYLGLMAIIMIPIFGTLLKTLEGLGPDTRDEARRWLAGNLKPEDVLLQTGYGVSWNEPAAFADKPLNGQTIQESMNNTEGGEVYLLLSSFAYQRYLDLPGKIPHQTEFFTGLLAAHETAARFERRGGPFGFHNPDIVILRLKPRE